VEASRLKLTTPRSVVHGSRLNNNRNKYNSDNNNDHDTRPILIRPDARWLKQISSQPASQPVPSPVCCPRVSI
jgi:hypothetical protein